MIRRTLPGGALCLALAACAPAGGPDVSQLGLGTAAAPEGAAPGACYARDVSPAVIETVTEQVLLQPAQITSDGRVLYPAVYKTETRQKIVEERQELWFETPCEADVTTDFVASLQRALAARGYYSGAITGWVTPRTKRAIRAYQAPRGLDSAVLSLKSAKELGLVAVGLDDGAIELGDPTDLPG
jgi:hypothetical protein